MSKKIAVLITDDFEDSEFTSPADAFKLAGHQVVTIEKQAGKKVKGKQGKQRSPSIKPLMTSHRVNLMPCCCRADIHRTSCAAMNALSPLPAILSTAASRSSPSATARSC
jgi:putative intracellular protease/amidase